MTRQSVTRSTILAGTTSVGMRKLTHDITTKIAVGKYTFNKYGDTQRESFISIPYTEQLPENIVKKGLQIAVLD